MIQLITCDKCKEQFSEEDGIAVYETKHHGILCEFCYDDLRDEVIANTEL